MRAVLLLPLMNTVVIPGLLLALTGDYRRDDSGLRWLAWSAGALLLAAGLGLAIRSIRLFVRIGGGTLAPWDPARALITSDIYRISRNPMKSGLFLVLIAECLLLGSAVLTIWTAAFVLANVIYIRQFEEPGLRRRFGTDYAAYCARVPRWLGLRGFRRAGAPAEVLS